MAVINRPRKKRRRRRAGNGENTFEEKERVSCRADINSPEERNVLAYVPDTHIPRNVIFDSELDHVGNQLSSAYIFINRISSVFTSRGDVVHLP